MKIAVDAMGGDFAPLAPVWGALRAREACGAELVLVGREDAILGALRARGKTELPAGVTIAPASEVVEIADDPATAFREKPDSSLTWGLTCSRTARRTASSPPAAPARCSRARRSSSGASAGCGARRSRP